MQRPWRLPGKLRRKYETAEALGLTEKLREVGWAGLSAKEAGRIGGTMRGKKQIIRQENECIQDLRKFTTR